MACGSVHLRHFRADGARSWATRWFCCFAYFRHRAGKFCGQAIHRLSSARQTTCKEGDLNRSQREKRCDISGCKVPRKKEIVIVEYRLIGSVPRQRKQRWWVMVGFNQVAVLRQGIAIQDGTSNYNRRCDYNGRHVARWHGCHPGKLAQKENQ